MFLSSKIFICFFFTSLISLESSLVSKVFVTAHWSILMIVSLKSFWTTLSSLPYWCCNMLFKFSLQPYFLWYNWFKKLNPGTLYYMRVWILRRPCILFFSDFAPLVEEKDSLSIFLMYFTALLFAVYPFGVGLSYWWINPVIITTVSLSLSGSGLFSVGYFISCECRQSPGSSSASAAPGSRTTDGVRSTSTMQEEPWRVVGSAPDLLWHHGQKHCAPHDSFMRAEAWTFHPTFVGVCVGGSMFLLRCLAGIEWLLSEHVLSC